VEDQKNQNQPIPFKKSAWKRFLGKKWAFPAIYIGTAAIILAIVMYFQGNAANSPAGSSQDKEGVSVTAPEDSSAAHDSHEDDAVAVSKTPESLALPVAKDVNYEMGMRFFDDQAPKEEQMKALVQYDKSVTPHTGVDFVSKDGKAFDVTAVLAGEVVKRENNDPLVGGIVEIKHENDMVTVYQGLENIAVNVGDKVTQGQKLGSAGRSVYEKDAGVHLHFEVRVKGEPVNPEQYLEKTQTQ
jgi:stage II sporulation protein Q